MPRKHANLFVLTAARDTDDPWAYLRDTVAQIEKQTAACSYRAIVCDGVYSGPKFGGWDVHSYLGKEPGSANRDPWFHVFRIAEDLRNDALCLEDDIEIAPGGLQRMLDFQVPGDLGFVQFFTSRALLNKSTKPGLFRAPCGSSRFLQATLYKHETLTKLAAYRHHPDYEKHPTSADQTVADACKTMHINHALHVPSLVQHVGAKSVNSPAAKLAWWRTADNFDAQMTCKDFSLYDYT
jgi:hypothetical protein